MNTFYDVEWDFEEILEEEIFKYNRGDFEEEIKEINFSNSESETPNLLILN